MARKTKPPVLPPDSVGSLVQSCLPELLPDTPPTALALLSIAAQLSLVVTRITGVLAEIKEEPIELPPAVKAEPSLPTLAPLQAAASTDLPLELGLFEDAPPCDDPVAERQRLARKYGVARFPESDLRDQLCGLPPTVDLLHLKPANQVQATTFQAHIDPYFRPYTDDDLEFLQRTTVAPATHDPNYDPGVSPFTIPKLGRVYLEVWAEEDSAVRLSPAPAAGAAGGAAHGSVAMISDDTLELETVSVGPLLARLLSGILGLAEAGQGVPVATQSINAPEEEHNATAPKADYATLEQRLRRELRYIGVFLNVVEGKESEWSEAEDDEVCVELRRLQKELSAITPVNAKRRRRLVAPVETQMAWQEYIHIKGDLDKQIDQAYVKRMKVPRARKKRPQTPAQTAQEQAAASGLRGLLDKKRRWVGKIGPLFKGEREMRRAPLESVFAGVDEESDEGGDEEA